MHLHRFILSTTTLLFVVVLPTLADTVVLEPVRDNTLFEEASGALSNGIGEFCFAGSTATGSLRRAALAFDIASVLPAGVVITGVELTLEMSRSINDDDHTIELRRLLTDWGEGTSNAIVMGGGQGADSTPGDATWVHTFFDASFWSALGGDFEPAASGSQTVGGIGSYTWTSTAQMVADVQGWVDNPASNFGWLLLGNEAVNASAKRFNTRENSEAATVPRLSITFDSLIFADGFESGDTTGWINP